MLLMPAFRFSFFSLLSQIVDFPIHLPKSDQHSSLHDLLLTSTSSSCRASQIYPLGNFDHSGVSVDISFE